MTFLQPFLLAALPLVALPVIIHLINQRRYQSVRWGAMMFLLAANRMSRGYARLRQWLILLFRMAAIAGLILAIARPLASGLVGLVAGGRPDTTIILLDRSPSMRQRGMGTAVSKLEAGRHQLAATLDALGSNHWVLIDSAARRPREIASPAELLELPATQPVDTSADLPAMLEAAWDYMHANQSGRTEIWICSDIRANDWNADDGRWRSLRDSFLGLSSVRFHLLAYAEDDHKNVAIRVTNVRRRQTNDGAELLVSLQLTRWKDANTPLSVPVQFDIEGARSEVTVDMAGSTYELKDHRIPIDGGRERGWGKVSIPADTNSADNDFYFVFDRPLRRRTVIVTDTPRTAGPLQLAAAISPDPAIECSAEVITLTQLPTVDWDVLSLLLWHAAWPDLDAASAVKAFVDRGGQVIFLPPQAATGDFMGIAWGRWMETEKGFPITTWRGDQDLLANTLSGAALPVGQLQVRRHRVLMGDELTALASLDDDLPLIARLPTDHGGVYFCSTTHNPSDSSLATNGVVFYVMVQRALAAGAAALGQTRQLIAGEAAPNQSVQWRQVVGPTDALSISFQHYGGVYSANDRLLAVNRSVAEDQADILASDRVAGLFKGLDFSHVDARPNRMDGLIQEVWRLFLFLMMLALLVEAALCVPRRRKPSSIVAEHVTSKEATEPFRSRASLRDAS